jgi:transposase InsO family protein
VNVLAKREKPEDKYSSKDELSLVFFSYRRVTALLRREGWTVNHKRVERLWRQEGLKVPQKQPKRKRLWLADGSCVRLRPSYKDHVWSYDFVADRTSDGRATRMLTLIDEHTRECLAIARQVMTRRNVTLTGTKTKIAKLRTPPRNQGILTLRCRTRQGMAPRVAIP